MSQAPNAAPPLPKLLYLFALCNLVVGTGAFVVGGIVQPIAASLQVSPAAAGQAMSAYALATAVLAPLLMLATGAWPRQRAMLLGLGLFAAGSLLSAWATNLGTLLMARVLMGAGAVFTPLAAGVAVAISASEQRGKALSLTFVGMSLSYAIGLPLGTWLGMQYGWRWPVGGVGVLCLLAMLAIFALVPRDLAAPGASFKGLSAIVRQPRVLRTLAVTLCYFISIFCVFSFIGPVLTTLNPLTPSGLSTTLAIFGVAGVMGTLSGGWATDRFGALRSLRVQISVLTLCCVLVPLTAGSQWLTVLVFFAWGVAGFGMMAPQQSRLATAAPTQAPLLLSFNTSMLYAGTALGAALSGMALGYGIGFAQLSWIGAPFAAVAAALLYADRDVRSG